MGAKESSTRTVSFENTTPIDLQSISLAEATVKRLQEHADYQEKNNNTVSAEQKSLESKSNLKSFLSPSFQSESNNSIEVVNENEKKNTEDTKKDIYWQNRMAYWKEALNGTYTVIEREYQNTLNDCQNKFPKALVVNCKPCRESEIKLLDCYRKNSGEPLKCSNNVLDFINCINKYRFNQVDEYTGYIQHLDNLM